MVGAAGMERAGPGSAASRSLMRRACQQRSRHLRPPLHGTGFRGFPARHDASAWHRGCTQTRRAAGFHLGPPSAARQGTVQWCARGLSREPGGRSISLASRTLAGGPIGTRVSCVQKSGSVSQDGGARSWAQHAMSGARRDTRKSTGSCAVLLRSKLGRSAPVDSTDMDGISAHPGALRGRQSVPAYRGKDMVTECLHCNT